MNRTVLGVCTAIVMSAALVGAQSKAQDNGKSSDANKSASASTATVTFTGCLSPKGTSDWFYLTNAKQKGVKGDAKTVKVLPANDKVDLAPHVTQQVEISGTLDEAGAAASGDASATPTLTVVKVKTRSDQCF